MYRIVLVDDEAVVIKGIRAMLDWQALNLRVVGTAGDGASGLELIRRTQPDIVITDVRMPGLSGLEMIEQAVALSPESSFIIFSGYSEYQYVKRAIRCGVVDYLEKPVAVSELQDALARASEAIHRRRQSDENRQAASRADIREILLTSLGRDGAGLERLIRHGIDVRTLKGVQVAVAREHTAEWDAERAEAVTAPLMEALSDRHVTPVCFRDGSLLIVILLLRTPVWKAGKELLEALRLQMTRHGYALVLGVGNRYADAGSLGQSYSEAVYALRYALFNSIRGLCLYNDVCRIRSIPPDLYRGRIAECVTRLDKAAGAALVRDALEAFRACRLSPERFQHECLEMINCALESLDNGSRGPVSRRLLEEGVPHSQLAGMGSYVEILTYMQSFFSRLLDTLGEHRGQGMHHMIVKARDYVARHYTEDLTLGAVAGAIGLNASYLSTLFKENTGMSYSSYLTSVRMHRAKQLLQDGEKVGRVSQVVGYHNYRHFCELFKQQEGVTPKQYRNQSTQYAEED